MFASSDSEEEQEEEKADTKLQTQIIHHTVESPSDGQEEKNTMTAMVRRSYEEYLVKRKQKPVKDIEWEGEGVTRKGKTFYPSVRLRREVRVSQSSSKPLNQRIGWR